MRILLVEDDPILGDGLRAGLAQAGHVVEWVTAADTATQVLAQEAFDLLVLDLGLPRGSGLDVLRGLRSRGNAVPVLILTAYDAVENRVAGLDAGADDYMTKPFALAELQARLRALSRRHRGRPVDLIEHADLVLDTAARALTQGGEPVILPRRELALLEALLENRGRVMSKERLADALYGWEGEVESNALEVYVHHLRKKLGGDLIRTIRGVGYLIDAPRENGA